MKKWLVNKPDENAVNTLIKETGLNPFICKILSGRGIADRADAESFFNSEELSDPFLMADMEKAVEIITEFVESGRKITVYGDYDCDGITATYMLFSYLEALGAEVDWYIPSREEGYGLNNAAVDLIHKKGTELIITVDNGISAADEAEHIAELGMTLIITDHHQVPEVLPKAAAVINPHRKDDMSVFRKIAGCGVVLRLISAMEGDCAMALDEYAPFAAVGTVGDIVTLKDENRLIVRRGLEALPMTENAGLRALMKKAGVDEENADSFDLAFKLCPRINAAGRCAHAKLAMELLLAASSNTAGAKADELNNLNAQRKQAEEQIIAEAEEQIRRNPDLLNKKVLIISGEGWHHGVIGIASSRLLHKYGMPNIVITIEGDTARGSARSFDGLPLYELLDNCKEHLIRFGGHAKAAGLTLEAGKIGVFTAAVHNFCEQKEKAVEEITADFEIQPAEITTENIGLIEKLSPFGEGNPAPLFLFKNCLIRSKKSMSEGKYVSFNFAYGKDEYRAVCFGSSFDSFGFEAGEYVDMIASAEINEFGGRRKIEMRVADVRRSDFNQNRYFAAKAAYEDYRCGKVDKRLLCRMAPGDSELRVCYDILRKTNCFSKAALQASQKGINYCMFRIMVDIFAEFGLAEYDLTRDYAALIPSKAKADLSKSKILDELKG